MGDIAGCRLLADRALHVCGRPDKDQASLNAGFYKRRVLREKTIAWMDCLRPRTLGHLDQGWDMQITLAGWCRANVVRLVRHAHVQRLAIGLTIHRHTGQTQFTAGANHAQGDLTAIGDQDFLEWPAGDG